MLEYLPYACLCWPCAVQNVADGFTAKKSRRATCNTGYFCVLATFLPAAYVANEAYIDFLRRAGKPIGLHCKSVLYDPFAKCICTTCWVADLESKFHAANTQQTKQPIMQQMKLMSMWDTQQLLHTTLHHSSCNPRCSPPSEVKWMPPNEHPFCARLS